MPKGRRLVRLAVQIDTLTHKTARAIEQALIDERREAWIDAYVKSAYPKFTGIRVYRRRVAESLDSITHLSDDEQAFLTAIVEEYERRMYDLLGKNMKATDNTWTPNKPETEEELSERWKKILEDWKARPNEMRAIRDWFHDQLEQGLGPAAFAEWDGTHTRLSKRPDWRPRHASGQPVQKLYDAPLCLSKREIELVLDRFGLDETKRVAIEELLENYQLDCRTSKTEQLEVTRYTDGPLEVSLIERSLKRDTQLLEAMKNELALDEASRMLDWLRLRRHRQLYTRNIRHDGEIDPVIFLFDAKVSTDHLRILAPMIDVYNQEANPQYLQRYHSVVRYQQESPENFAKLILTNDEIDELNRRIAILNDKTIRQMTTALPEQLGARILDTFLRASNRFIFQDPSALHKLFRRESLKTNLSSGQRQQIEDLRADYIIRYAELTDAMISLCVDADYWSRSRSGESFVVPKRNHWVIEAYPPLRNERDDLNASTNVRIRTILTPQQVRAIGGLPDLD